MRVGQQTRKCSAGGKGGRCQGSEEISHCQGSPKSCCVLSCEGTSGRRKTQGFARWPRSPENWPHGSNTGRKIKAFFAAGLGEEGVETILLIQYQWPDKGSLVWLEVNGTTTSCFSSIRGVKLCPGRTSWRETQHPKPNRVLLFSNHRVQQVGITYKSGTGDEGSLRQTKTQRLLEQEDLTSPLQRQAKAL